jgi:hypothetical protein
MTPLDLMAAVLPSPGNGYYCAVELTKKKQHVYGQTLEELMPTVEKWAKAGYDTYFALGTFGTDKDRTKENMHGSQVLAVDLDCNHPKDIPNEEGVIKPKAYPSAKAAAQALQQQLGLYNVPLNQITALMSGSQIQAPQFQQYSGGGQIGAAPVAQAATNQGNYNTAAYNAQMGALGGLYSGIGSIGGAAAGAAIM